MSLPRILTSHEEVSEFAKGLAQWQTIAVDLEADSMHNYQEKVCLLQFSVPGETVLIDPLAGAALDPLKPVLADSRVRKIFHAADYDIRCLARDFAIEIKGLFDTMISSQFLGEEKFGLADVLRKYFAVELDKKYQRADWSKRPLTEGMIRYAGEDTSHLHQLAEILEQKLIDKGRLGWVQEEFAILEQVRFSVHEGPLFLRFKGAGTLDRRALAILENLLCWRDNEARRRDCPLYKVLGNKVLLELARLKPGGRGKLKEVEGMSPRLIERYGGQLQQQIALAAELPEEELPVFPRRERRQKEPQFDRRLSMLKEWRKKIAGSLEVDPGVLINNSLLEELAYRCPRGEQELAEIPLMKNWQREVLGREILEILN